jgi:mRNA-degrading endonuclease RelE of RelBE toxin-antitoxin system
MSLPPKTVYALLQQVLKDPEIGPCAISEAKKQCPGLLALISETKKELQKASQVEMLHDYDPCRRLHIGQYVLIFHKQFFHTHGSLVNSHFLSTGSSPPEKTIRGKKNDNVILGNLKRYGIFIPLGFP